MGKKKEPIRCETLTEALNVAEKQKTKRTQRIVYKDGAWEVSIKY